MVHFSRSACGVLMGVAKPLNNLGVKMSVDVTHDHDLKTMTLKHLYQYGILVVKMPHPKPVAISQRHENSSSD